MTRVRKARCFSAFLLVASITPAAVCAQESATAIYQQLKAFDLSGGSAPASNVVLKRDRGVMTFSSGTFYFSAPVAGKVRSAVFIGAGNFRADVPPSEFEKEHVKRMLGADVVESDFRIAVLRFTDDTYEIIKAGVTQGSASPEAMKVAEEFEARMLKEVGANLAARLALSIVNRESPGFFAAEFDKGRRKRFTFIMDYQSRVPSATFGVNGGEKGVVFFCRDEVWGGADIWMAFYSLEDYQSGRVHYSDAFDLIDTKHYEIKMDVREPGRRLSGQVRMEMTTLADGVQAIPFALTESLGAYDDARLKWRMKVTKASAADGSPLEIWAADWETGFTLVLPMAKRKGEKFEATLEMEGDFLVESNERGAAVWAGAKIVRINDCHYPLSNGEWYPRHGYLRRSTFDMTFDHKKGHRVAAVGIRVAETPTQTRWKMDRPVSFVTFAVGPFVRHEETLTDRGLKIPVEFHSLTGQVISIKEDFVTAEMMNALNYYSAKFGEYPYGRLSAAFHPFGFGQGFPSLLLIPNTDRASKYTFSFIAHEVAHQWWGNVVGWRSYRDQWLSEGFAEHSGLLYTALRDRPESAKDLINEMRRVLLYPPMITRGGFVLGAGRGRLVDVGPIILGHRLNTRETLGAYVALTYSKGGLVLRMLHFLFTDPATGNSEPFFKMMADFVKRNENGWATTEGFVQVANEHFVKTPIAQKYQLKDLNWFFRQWVYQTHLPSYRLEFTAQPEPDGRVLLQGTLMQENAPADWFMPLPLTFEFEGGKKATTAIHASGPTTTFQLRLPAKPKKVELDPELWVLSERTVTRQK